MKPAPNDKTQSSGAAGQKATKAQKKRAKAGQMVSRAAYWPVQDADQARCLPHLPFVFWMMESLAPRRIVSLGLEDPSGFAALCRAAERLGLDASCLAVDLAGADAAPAELPQALALVVAEPLQTAIRHLRGKSIDLLVIDGALSAAQAEALREIWLPRLSERGVLMIHDPETTLAEPALAETISQLAASHPWIGFPATHPGLDVLLLGRNMPQGLLDMAQSAPGSSEAASPRQILARLGESLVHARAARQAEGELARSRSALSQAETRIAQLEAALARQQEIARELLEIEADQLRQLAELRAQAFDLSLERERALGSEAPAPLAATPALRPKPARDTVSRPRKSAKGRVSS